MRSKKLLLLVPLALLACNRISNQEAIRVVEEYNRIVTEAYRAGDARSLEGAVGPKELKKLGGLIGVKLDLGFTLDAQLLDLKVLNVERRGKEVLVNTDESWHYADRRVGTGEQIGQDSEDHYRMHYILRKPAGRWVVDEIEFASPPKIGRKETPLTGPVEALHGSFKSAQPVEGSPGAAARGGTP
ncbi:MAG TPA: hypothetical protein VFE30_02000 [Anaeromyxobacteraceae bacterium]|jgi:hypothetical protein|nr:hypothetical protein [Anaeromyxobacteraceae bacterium]